MYLMLQNKNINYSLLFKTRIEMVKTILIKIIKDKLI